MTFLHRISFFCLIFTAVLGFGFESAEASPQEEKPQIAKNIDVTSDKPAVAEEETTPKTEEKKADSKTNNYTINYNRVGVQTDRTMPLTLNDAITKALENNNDIEVARTDVRIQEQSLRSLLGTYDPVFSVTPTYSRNATTGSSASNDFRVDSSFNQLISRGGGSYNAFFNTSQTGSTSPNNTNFNQTSTLSSTSSTTYFSNLGVSFTQPLFKNRSIDNTRRQIKIQRKRLQQSDADFRRQTINIISQVQRAYWDLVFALRDQQNRVANLNLARESLRQVEAKIEAGASAPLARAEVNTEVANRESDLLIATQQVSIAENSLKTLVLRDPTSTEWEASYVPTDRPVYSDEPVVMGDAVKDAMDNRPELQRLKLQKEINDIDIRYFRNQTKPQIDFNSTFSLGGLSLGNVNTSSTISPLIPVGFESVSADAYLLQQINSVRGYLGIGAVTPPTVTSPGVSNFFNGGTLRSLQNLFRTDAPSYSFGVTFSFPLGNRTAKANLAGAQIQQEQTNAQTRGQEQIVIAEVRNAVQALETARQRVLSARKARENAEIQLAGEQKLFEAGRSTTFLLFQRENALANARNAEIRSETDYNKAISDLQRATSTTFQLNNIEITSPMNDK
ncbi:MAG: TolC family protein [Pyrinomonadaceae bacterium]